MNDISLRLRWCWFFPCKRSVSLSSTSWEKLRWIPFFGIIFIFIPEILGEIGHLQPQQNKLGTVPVDPQAVWSDSKPLVLAPPGQPWMDGSLATSEKSGNGSYALRNKDFESCLKWWIHNRCELCLRWLANIYHFLLIILCDSPHREMTILSSLALPCVMSWTVAKIG